LIVAEVQHVRESVLVAYTVVTAEEAHTVIERFNGFHDGFIERLALRSHDYFPERGVHTTTGPLDLDIIFAHYNYDDGVPPHDQRIEATFTGVRNLAMQFTGAPTDWPIIGLYLEVVAGPDARHERLLARLIQPRLIDAHWDHVEALRFTFERAQFSEIQR